MSGRETMIYIRVPFFRLSFSLWWVPIIVIQTHKTDKYDRYLSDIFWPKRDILGELRSILCMGLSLASGMFITLN